MAHVAMKAWLAKYIIHQIIRESNFFMQYTRSKVFSGKNIQTYWMQLVGAPNCTESFDRNVSTEMRSTIILRCVD